MSRRSFLAAGCVGVVSSTLPFINTARADDGNGKMKIRVIFVLRGPVADLPCWPNIGFNFVPVMEETIDALNSRCSGIDFIPGMSGTNAQIQRILSEDAAAGNIDGYLVMQMQTNVRAWEPVLGTGKPVLFTEMIYGGGGAFLRPTSRLLRRRVPNFAFITGGSLDDLVAAAQNYQL